MPIPESVNGNTNAEQVSATFNDVTASSNVSCSDTTSQGLYTDAVCCLSKVFTKCYKVVK